MGFRYKETLTSIAAALIFFQTTNAELVVKPTDAETLVGELTYFNCSTSVVSQAVQWFHYRVGGSGDRSIVYGYDQFYDPYKGRFMIEKSEATGRYNLVITSVQVQDAGKYECQDDVGRGAKASARLIVLDKSPICQINQTTNEVIGPNICSIPLGELQLTCSATYHGDDAPVLKWFEDGSDQPLVDGVSTSSSGNRFLSNLSLKADSIKDGSSFHCRTTRSRLTQHSCTSGSIKIIGTHATCPNTKPYVDAILVICLFLIPIIIAASVVGGIYIQTRWRLKLFERPVKRKDKERYPKQAEQTSWEDVPLRTEVTESNEPQSFPKKDAKATEEQSEQYEQLIKFAKNNKEKDKEIADLKKKSKQLEDEKCELEGWLYPPAITSYSDNPKSVIAIDIKDLKTDSKEKKKKPIFGMTILSNKLLVVTEKSSEVEVYDSVTFTSESRWQIAAMSNPLDIASCSTNDCLYICDGTSKNEMNILRVDSSQNLLNRWSIDEEAGHLSVTREGNVVVSLFNGNKINEYSSDGHLIREVRLSPADNIIHPWHAIRTTSMHFIFSHGLGEDPLQRVCVANADGKIIKSFGGRKGKDIEAQHMNRPVHLLEDGSRNVLVADMKNKRVLLLSPTLEYRRILVSDDKGKLRFPMRLCLDEERGILFVADNNYKEKASTYDSGRILIFNCRA